MRRLALALGATLAALAAPAGSPAMDDHMHDSMAGDAPAAGISILVGSYTPAHVDVLAGDTVRWTNDSVRTHNVSAQDDAWSSGRLLGNERFGHRFDTPASVPYYCTLHPFMRGEVDVHRVLLRPPAEPGAPGRPYVFHGRAALPAGTAVTIEADSGSGFQPAGAATVEADGSFTSDVIARTTASYRAVTGEETSPAVQLLVLDRKLAVSSGGRGRAVKVSARVAPGSHGAPVVLELRLPQHFGWWPVARAKLDHASMARFSLRLAHRYPARVVLTLKDGATALAVSRTLHVGPR
jgi:plastocyanin